MASGKTHSVVNFTAISFLFAIACWSSEVPLKMALVSSFSAIFGTIFLSPDLDLKQSHSSQSWGWFKWLWYAYHRCFGHRRLSHFFIIGTITRLLYLSMLTVLVISIYSFIDSFIYGFNVQNAVSAENNIAELIIHCTYWIADNNLLLFAVFIGLLVADTLHFITDILSSLYKKMI